MRSSFTARTLAVAAAFVGTLLVLAPAGAAPALAPAGGDPAPALVLRDTQGAAHDLARYRGKVVLINFWATWCEPCRHEMPSMQRLRDKLSGRPFVVLAVNVDEPDARVRRFLEETRLDLPVVLDVNRTVTRAWNVRVMPTSFIVDTAGRLRYRVVGDIDWTADTVLGTLSQLLGGG
jgi:peroxiredoxin